MKKKYNNNKQKGFLIVLTLLAVLSMSLMLAATLPAMTQMMQSDTNVDRQVLNCIKGNDSTGWFTDANGDTSLPTSGTSCYAAVVDIENDRETALYTASWFAGNGDANQQIMAKKILRAACDQGGSRACDYFISSCIIDSSTCDELDTDPDGYLDLSYYLTQDQSSTIDGAVYIDEQLRTIYLPQLVTNIENQVDADCSSTGNEIACDLTGNWKYIAACNHGYSAACTTAWNNNYNQSCSEVYCNWDDAPTGLYRLSATSTDPKTHCNWSASPISCDPGGTPPPEPPDPDIDGDLDTTDDVTTIGVNLKVTTVNVGVSVSANDTDPGTSAKCWYGLGSECSSQGCGTDTGGGNYDKYLCNHEGAVAACEALNEGVNYGTGCQTEVGCAPTTTGWRLPTYHEMKMWRTDYISTSELTSECDTELKLCNYNSNLIPYCGYYSGCNGSLDSMCYPSQIWARDSVDNNFYNFYLINDMWKVLPYGNNPDYAFSVRCVRSIL